MTEKTHADTLPTETEEEEEVLPEDDVDDDIESFDESAFDPVQQITQLLVTEAGVPVVDVLQGIQEALDKQNKILYKLVSTIESKQCK